MRSKVETLGNSTEFLDSSYLNNSFFINEDQEVSFLVDVYFGKFYQQITFTEVEAFLLFRSTFLERLK